MNFVSRSGWSALTLLALGVGVVGSLYELQQREVMLTQLEEQEGLGQRLERALNRAERHAVDPLQRNPKATAESREVAVSLQRPWEAMLDALQAAARPDMQITRLQPDTDGDGLLVSGQADSSAAFLGYLQRLQQQGNWAAVVPVSEAQEASPAPGGKPLSFQLRARWREHQP